MSKLAEQADELIRLKRMAYDRDRASPRVYGAIRDMEAKLRASIVMHERKSKKGKAA